MSPRGAIIGSQTWDKFGILVGISGVKTKTRVDGFESVGWTDGNLNSLGRRPTANNGNGFLYAPVPCRTTFAIHAAAAPLDARRLSNLAASPLMF